jgi:hypothetical protein
MHGSRRRAAGLLTQRIYASSNSSSGSSSAAPSGSGGDGGGPLGAARRALASFQKSGSELQAQLQALGVAGVLAYGVLNTAYYTSAFLFFWTQVACVPPGLGAAAVAQRFAQVMATVWAGSQVTKLARAAGAVALAPLLDRALDATQRRLQLRGGKRQASLLLVAACLSLALALFAGVVVLWS